jgi:DNA-binding transcriptional LysR family regulator
MELYQLRTFAVVAELGNLTQAAERLHVSQPAASAQIKTLEAELGVTLFERKKSGLYLTQAGEALRPKIESLLATASEIASEAKSLSGRLTGPIRLGIIGTIDKSILRLEEMMTLILRRRANFEIELQHQNSRSNGKIGLQQQNSRSNGKIEPQDQNSRTKFEIELQHKNSRSIVDAVASRKFDAGICMCSSNIPGLRCIPLKKINHRIVAPFNWGGNIRKASWRELASRPWISVPRAGSHHIMIMQLFRRLRLQPDKYVLADSEPTITSLVVAGAGLALMREELALQLEEEEQIVVVDKGHPSIYLNFIYRKGCDDDPVIRAILEVLRELWPEARRASPTGIANSKQPLDAAAISAKSMSILLRKAAK